MISRGKTTWFALLVLVGIGLLGAGISTSNAQVPTNVNWNVAGPAPWGDDANWDLLVVPDASFLDTAVVGNGGTAVVDSQVPDTFGFMLTNGVVDVQQGGSLTVEEGSTIGGSGTLRLSGSGAFSTGSLTSTGLIDLDSSTASLAVGGTFSSQAAATLQLGISGGGSAVLDVGGAARLGGTLVANFDAGVDAAFGSSWEFLQAGSIEGQFRQIALPPGAPPLERGLELQMVTTGGTAALTVGNVPVLSMDRATGRTELKNLVGGPLTITGYTISSGSGQLNPQGWNSLAAQQVDGWSEANPGASGISELNLEGSITLDVGESVVLGNAYGAGPASPLEENVDFTFSTLDGRVLGGLVEFTGPANDLVLRVNPEDGEAVIRNLSSKVDPFDVNGYSILSLSGALSPGNWTSFADTGAAGAGWVEANPIAGGLSELNLEGSHIFGTGTTIPLGPIFTAGSLQDLIFRYSTPDGDVRDGTVEYGAIDMQLPGDCNGDGVVDIVDADCTPLSGLDDFLSSIGSLRGDVDGDGEVQFPDFVVLANNFGSPGTYTQGDFDKDGEVQFPDFVILANNFGQMGAVAAAVPEPSAGILVVGGVAVALAAGRRRATSGKKVGSGV